MPDGLKETLAEIARAALTAGAAAGAAKTFPLVLAGAQKLGKTFAAGTIGKMLQELPRRRAAELVTLVGQAFAEGVACGAGLKNTNK